MPIMETATVLKQNETSEYDSVLTVHFKNTIGKGSFGQVKYCVAKIKNHLVGFAVKILRERSAVYQDNRWLIDNEVSVATRVQHPNLITFFFNVKYHRSVYIYMEYCKHGDMKQIIRKYGPYVEPDARLLFAQIVAAIEYLHGQDIAHRDLKPENVLLNHRNQVKVSDFGLADYFRDPISNRRILSYSRCGTKTFMPPEVLKSTSRGYNAMFFDIWSLGGVLHYMLTGKIPFDGRTTKVMLAQQTSGDIVLSRSEYEKTVSDHAKRLIWLMLEPDILKRARISVIKQSEWMTSDSHTFPAKY